MLKVLIAPSRYVQGPGALDEVGRYLKDLGGSVFVIGGRTALSIAWERVRSSCESVGLTVRPCEFRGESTDREIERLRGLLDGAEVVVGVGGGKAIDTAKAVAALAGSRCAVVPTTAATDAPCSALSVIYGEDGGVERYFILPRNPDLVLVDSEVIARAPVRFLVSGMGDALATWFEARACSRSAARNVPGGRSTVSALELARLCYDTLLDYGYLAKISVEAGALTEAVERVIEANTLLSGLGFESSGLAAAHAVHDGLAALPETHGRYHGEKVAFGTLVQLVLENAPPEEIEEVVGFCRSVGLPTTLEELGVDVRDVEKLRAVAETSCREGSTILNMPFPVTPDMVRNALLAADALGRAASLDEKDLAFGGAFRRIPETDRPVSGESIH